ncbi:RNA replication protein [Labeo rohita]|uniref:RNA replication protein n=1 Tax=Labeo rohita TaxID=84645 RepID=A0ABQ8L5A9_LABRO|nr:RNA replication protein [Labeo rohita]
MSTAHLKIETRCGCFYISVFLKESDCLHYMSSCNFNFILHAMHDKTAFVSGALHVHSCYRGKPYTLQHHLLLPENEFAYICHHK